MADSELKRRRQDEIQEIKRRGVANKRVQVDFSSKGISFTSAHPNTSSIGCGYTNTAAKHGFMVSSKKPNDTPNIPQKVEKKVETFKIPPKKKAKTTVSDSEDEEEENHFRMPLPTPINKPKLIKNPFGAKLFKPEPTLHKPTPRQPSIRQPTIDQPLWQLDDSDDFKVEEKATLIKPSKDTRSFNLPKKPIVNKEEQRENEKLLNSLKRAQKQFEYDSDKKKCPFCSELLHPMSKIISDALKEIERKDTEYKEKQQKIIKKENSNSSFTTPDFITTKRQASLSEKDAFCNLHHIELVVKPDGIENDYPTTINFDGIEKRIEKFDKELKDVIANKLKSNYRTIAENAYRDEGTTRARSAISVMNRFQKALPGYYGPKGSIYILNALTKRYLNTGYLEQNLVSPQLPLEFLQQVLVPEAGFRLIRQDLLRKQVVSDANEKAKAIMLESIEYGSAIFPTDDDVV